ncbi:S41A family C-terminal processing peptidase-3 [Mucilaginibacter gracilis]|uniref:S41A family C-terminal processing peptidase-3 n=1 Tax=Mucilaginibacter gracilis TaxID=423350 RepID=A0A495J3Y7_9SPHI|nr:S41 family peptidase [Mucilaginibacter gracilis]RKR83690.1 S41A family C-terminal processing peptidase-3 [Mucilaginibacter gracilis]
MAACQFTSAQISTKDKLYTALTAIQKNYVDSLSDQALIDAAIKGMFTSLDPHSKYFSAKEAQEMKTMMSGSFVGIGIQYISQNDSVFITQIIPGGPAEKGGIMPGDRILKIDSEVVTGARFSNMDILKKIRGVNNSPIRLELYRQASKRKITVNLIRGAVADHSVRAAYMLNSDIGYISIGIFAQTTQPEIEDALKSLKKQGMRSLILDLQGNGGGYVEAALGVADEFLKKDQMVYYTVDRDKGRDYYYASASGTSWGGKLVVLVDQNTASASELLAGALQDWDRAVIVGRRTFGKGLTQRPVPLPDGSVLELTGGRLFTPAGRTVQKPYKGVNYNADITNRYMSGELFSDKPITLPDSLKTHTLVSKRVIYNHSGILPDKLVPLDTLQDATWLKAVAATGAVNQTAWQLVDEHRDELKAAYPDFDAFNSGYKVAQRKINEIARVAEKQGIQLPVHNKDRIFDLLALEIKAEIAAQLFSGHEYYLRVISKENTSIREAINILNNGRQYSTYLDGAKAL